MLLLLQLLFTVYFSDARAQSDVPYSERLAGLEEMAADMEHESLGVLGGLYVQTHWQLVTHRDEIPAWNHINSYLTVKPRQFLLTYLEKGEDSCDTDLCSTWLDYFQAEFNGYHRSAQHLLWKAHLASIFQAIEVKPGILNDEQVPLDERNFLKGWIRFVQAMAKIRLPTQERFIRRLSTPTLPQCAPLGAPTCEVQDLPLTVRVFTKRIIRLGERANHF